MGSEPSEMVVFAGDFPSGDRTGFTEKTMVVSEVMGIPKNHRFQYFNTQV